MIIELFGSGLNEFKVVLEKTGRYGVNVISGSGVVFFPGWKSEAFLYEDGLKPLLNALGITARVVVGVGESHGNQT